MSDVHKIGEPDVPEVAETLTEAFLPDPVMRWWVPDDGRRKDILQSFFDLVGRAYLPGEEIYSLDGVAAAIWAPPGVQSTEEEMAEFGRAVAEISGDCAERGFALMEAMEAVHPKQDHYYLFFIGARAAFQRRGHGSALLREVLQRCDATGTPAYLEASSPNNKRLYERHGFVAWDPVTVDDSPPLWPMWREPRS
jgi:ribosomal protein S18 acetylase RimI-like enzyme